MPWLTVEAAGSTLERGSLNEGEAAGQTQRHPSSYHRCHLRGSLPSSHHHPAFPKHTSSILLWVSVCVFSGTFFLQISAWLASSLLQV